MWRGKGADKVWAKCGRGVDSLRALTITLSSTSCIQSLLRHCRRSGIFGSGLITLSRWPILETAFHQYSAPGDALALTCGDYLAVKGVGKCEYAFPRTWSGGRAGADQW